MSNDFVKIEVSIFSQPVERLIKSGLQSQIGNFKVSIQFWIVDSQLHVPKTLSVFEDIPYITRPFEVYCPFARIIPDCFQAI